MKKLLLVFTLLLQIATVLLENKHLRKFISKVFHKVILILSFIYKNLMLHVISQKNIPW